MKKILYAISMMALLLCACSEDEKDKVPEDSMTPDNKPTIENTLEFETKELVFTPQKNSGSIHINTNIEYIVELDGENKDWIKYDANSNKYISFEARPNNSENERSVKCIISNKELKLSDTLYIKQSINKERLALIGIYKSLNGDQWVNNENWCSDEPLNEWEGVMAKGDAEVYRLWISHDAYVKGEIPDCIGDLTFLENISFEYSNVKGKLPKAMGNLTKLKRLTIGNCQLEGEIPESIYNCTQLEYVDMSKNNFIGKIPSFLFLCSNLSYLNLSENNFEELYIDKEPKCNKLNAIFINDNKIHTPIPSKIFNMRGLSVLYAYNNMISGEIPMNIGESLNLTSLYLYNNKLTGKLPESMVNMTMLESFSIIGNYLDVSNTDYLKTNPNYNNWSFENQNIL